MRLQGLHLTPRPLGPVIGDAFARAAYYEAGSAVAYARLHRELAAHGAPERLVSACDGARLAVICHAGALGALASRYGAVVPVLETRPHELEVRPLAVVAIDNAVEGVVRETYAAAVARFRARWARDAEVRPVMAMIAADACAHAELAFRVAEWIELRLSMRDRARVVDAVRVAVAELRDEIDVEPAAGLRVGTGAPSRDEALAILGGLAKSVWPVAA